MAKSIRSKWRRKCRAVKRERYGKKELDRLKKTLGIDETQVKIDDEKMQEISDIATVQTAETISKKSQETEASTKTDETTMDTTDPNKRIFNSKTFRDQHGTYPVWVHPRKIMKKKKGRKGKKGKARKSF